MRCGRRTRRTGLGGREGKDIPHMIADGNDGF